MADSLSNKYAKNLCKQTVLVQLITNNVVTCFFWNTVYVNLLSFTHIKSRLVHCVVVEVCSASVCTKLTTS